jgi:acyl-[acyl-carrier-protein] desaturase
MPDDPSLTTVEQHVSDYLTSTDALGFNRYTDFDWANLPESLRNSRVTDLHISAVETAMIVEDHIPQYGSEYIRLFPIDPDRSDADLWCNRQMLHFVFRWVMEEDRHAHVLELWLRHSGRRDPAQLTQLMVSEGKKVWHAPHDIPSQLFTYTALQEKATQLYYTCLRHAIDEPVLRSALGRLSQDEARHCAFFSKLVVDSVVHGNQKTMLQLREALEQFRMPLSDMMENYKRKAIQMMRAASGYDYREAFDYYARLLRRVADSRTTARGSGLMDLLAFAQASVPSR